MNRCCLQYKKYRLAEFGRCPRTMCKNQPVVPVSFFWVWKLCLLIGCVIVSCLLIGLWY